MDRILHILTRANDVLAGELILRQKQAGQTTAVVDLTKPEPDYTALLEKIFEADSVEVW